GLAALPQTTTVIPHLMRDPAGRAPNPPYPVALDTGSAVRSAPLVRYDAGGEDGVEDRTGAERAKRQQFRRSLSLWNKIS
ncbi:hypothetical protein, partial [Pseudovibrio sp. SPO723]|uniref:hypothetical protein n=1 Tax=Nesiotobacter zosterae TaxID=392721 RepID=UPI0029C458C0